MWIIIFSLIKEAGVKEHIKNILVRIQDLRMLLKAAPHRWVDIVSDFFLNPERFADRVEEEKKFRQKVESGWRK